MAIVCIILLLAMTHDGLLLSIGTPLLAIAVLVRVRERVEARQTVIKVLTLCVFVSALNYLVWRFGAVNWDAWWLSVPLVAAEMFGLLHTLGLQYTVWPRQAPKISHDEIPMLRPIFIFIPTVNEGRDVLIPTVQGALRAQKRYLAAYPNGKVTIVICNDGYIANTPDWKEAERIAERFQVTCITRTVEGGAKAGNIENARQVMGATGDALIVIFDADQIAEPEFLLKMIPPFSDSSIGWVQSGQYYRNLDNAVSHWANDQQALFYRILCPNKSNQNAAFICGTNVVLRAAALDEIGGLPQDSLTEDFAASIVLHARWRSIFLPDVLATGLGPMTLTSYLKQQNRWAIGTLSVFGKHWRRIILPSRHGLTVQQRIQYVLACTHYLCGLRDLIFIFAPIVFLLTGIPAVKGAGLTEFLAHFLPYWIASQIAFWYLGWGKTSVRGILIGFGSFYVLMGSLLTVITGRRVGFTVTAKMRNTDNLVRALRPHMIAFGLCVVAVIIGLSRPPAVPEQAKSLMSTFSIVATQHFAPEQGRTLVSVFWVVYAMCLLSGMLWLGYKDLRHDAEVERRRAIDHTDRTPVLAHLRPAPKWAALVAVVIAAATVTGVLVPRQSRAQASESARFAVSATTGARVFGLTLAAETLNTAPQKVEREVGTRPGIIGRVQDITDTFDRTWADNLAKQGECPWVTLIFRMPQGPAYMSSLPAIANGIYDDLLKRWAQAIADYGKPVYLTILPHVDRNWSISSAVTNAGIPQDVPNAWLHVRHIFDGEGVKNVAWVWAPADPINDQLYAPSSSSVDVVLISMINYPNTPWANPQKTLANLVQRYPDKPLFVEISAAGDPANKAAWLQQLGAAIATQPTVRALFYHEGSPDLLPTANQNRMWSLASDVQSLNAVKGMLAITVPRDPRVLQF
ncbi:MAG: glycosyltransferase [Aggregatilineales bacterium]